MTNPVANTGSTPNSNAKLFQPLAAGPLSLRNRVAMAPMTRSRAPGAVPNALMREYYRQRAGAGLIISEGVAPAPEALGRLTHNLYFQNNLPYFLLGGQP